jgi:hypothetical protein
LTEPLQKWLRLSRRNILTDLKTQPHVFVPQAQTRHVFFKLRETSKYPMATQKPVFRAGKHTERGVRIQYDTVGQFFKIFYEKRTFGGLNTSETGVSGQNAS